MYWHRFCTPTIYLEQSAWGHTLQFIQGSMKKKKSDSALPFSRPRREVGGGILKPSKNKQYTFCFQICAEIPPQWFVVHDDLGESVVTFFSLCRASVYARATVLGIERFLVELRLRACQENIAHHRTKTNADHPAAPDTTKV